MHPEALVHIRIRAPISRVQCQKRHSGRLNGRIHATIAAVERRDGRHGRPGARGHGRHGRCRRPGRSRAVAGVTSAPSPSFRAQFPTQRPRSAAPVGGALRAVNGVYIEVLGKGEPELLVLDGSQHR